MIFYVAKLGLNPDIFSYEEFEEPTNFEMALLLYNQSYIFYSICLLE